MKAAAAASHADWWVPGPRVYLRAFRGGPAIRRHTLPPSSLAGIRMELFLQFVVAKWYLFGAMAVLVSLLFAHESRKGGASVSPAQLTGMVNREDAVVLDLRDAADYRQGHIVGSINMPFGKLSERVAELERYRDRPIVVVCKMGHHSGAVAKTLKEKGFARVFRLGGGMMEWQGAQLPTVRS
jgi:rhodanese-related sulfurtransferase